MIFLYVGTYKAKKMCALSRFTVISLPLCKTKDWSKSINFRIHFTHNSTKFIGFIRHETIRLKVLLHILMLAEGVSVIHIIESIDNDEMI